MCTHPTAASFSKGILSSRDCRGDLCKQASSDSGKKGSENTVVSWVTGYSCNPTPLLSPGSWVLTSLEQRSGSWWVGGILVLCGVSADPSPYQFFQTQSLWTWSFPEARPQKHLPKPWPQPPSRTGHLPLCIRTLHAQVILLILGWELLRAVCVFFFLVSPSCNPAYRWLSAHFEWREGGKEGQT